MKRKEKEYELETQKLARDKIVAQERIATLKRELTQMGVEVDLANFISQDDEETHSDSTATGKLNLCFLLKHNIGDCVVRLVRSSCLVLVMS